MILRNLINSTGWNINICQKADKNMISAVSCKSICSNSLGFCTQTKMMQSPAIDFFLPKRFFISKMCIFFHIYNLETLYFHNIAMFFINRQPVNFSPGSSYLTQSYRLSALMFNHMPPHGQRASCLIRLNLPGPVTLLCTGPAGRHWTSAGWQRTMPAAGDLKTCHFLSMAMADKSVCTQE